MAFRSVKRKRAAVSYKEPSTDEDVSGDSDSGGNSARRRPQRPQRRSVRQAAREQSEDATGERQPTTSRREQTIIEEVRRPTRQRRRIVSYQESSSNEDFDTDYEEAEPLTAPVRQNTKTSRPHRTQKRTSTVNQPRRGLGAPPKRRNNSKSATPAPTIPSDGKIPPWASLPYHVLLQILVYASYPLHDDNFMPTSSIAWLARMARMCSTFTAPALAALYRNPPIFAIRQKRKDLVNHLITPPPEAHQRYQVLPKRLELDSLKMSHLTDPTHSTNDLLALIKSLKTLRHIDIFDPYDNPPYRWLRKTTRTWKYPDELFNALRESELRLSSWRWNTSFFTHGLLWMKEMHTDKAFANLKEVTLTKFAHDDSNRKEGTVPLKEELLASALAVLPRLKALTFESCTIVNERLLPLLPPSLVSLNLTNCEELKSEALQSFLITHGSQLEDLVLNHNRSLDISFLVDLKRSCPKLEILRMDLNCYSSLALTNDSDPNYDEMLKEGEIPTWPSALGVIEIEYLRKWTPAAAKGFFSSLIDSAHELLYLRELRISAMVDIDWRERAAFRGEWTARFQHVFLSRAPLPSEHLRSLRAFREWKAAQSSNQEKNDSFIDSDHKNEVEDEDDSDAPLLFRRPRRDYVQIRADQKWNSKRLRTRARPSSSGGETSYEDVSTPVVDYEGVFVQGRCEKVDFRLDNFRPREERFSENDFLDSEASGDEDWDGQDYDVEGYAW